MPTISDLDLLLKTVPQDPGVYQYYDSDGKILYVGKAKNLKKRVLSYFTSSVNHSPKTRVMVSKIADIKYIVVDTPSDALLLENSMIKSLRPRYNIMLKDDKTYPWICITNENFPRIFLTRKKANRSWEYYGPYSSVGTAHLIIDIIKSLSPIRTCKFDLSEGNILKGNIKPCLEYHIKNCKAPCAGYQTLQDYDQGIETARKIIKGQFGGLISDLRKQMNDLSRSLQFENAQLVKEKLNRLQNYQTHSTVVSPSISNVDVFSIVSDDSYAYVNFLKIVKGAVIQSHTIEMKKAMEESDPELLSLGIAEIQAIFDLAPTEIYLPMEIDTYFGSGVKVTVPRIAEKKRLIELSEKNARMARLERFKQERITDPEAHTNTLMRTMQKDLQLPVEPRHIECFDNSNIQGTNAVSACVVFKDGRPSKKDYRHFNVQTVIGPDDFATMREAMMRRYSRLKSEGDKLPDLIIVDGGKGQLSAAYDILLDLGLEDKIKIIGIAKRLEEIFYPEDPIPLYLDKRSQTLRVIQQLRDEAHRFGITHHRKRRSKEAIESELDHIKGIGEKTKEILINHFGSISKIKNASIDDLCKITSKSRAELILEYFRKV